MSFSIHRAQRADRLVDALAEVLATPPEDPFAVDLVCVPTPGVERWLAQRLSHRLGTSPGGRDGICAGVAFPSPRRLRAAVTGAGHGRDDPDPWRQDRAVWPLLALVDESRGEDWAELLWSYLSEDGSEPGGSQDGTPSGGRRWRTARRVADLFARYAATRPGLLVEWDAGRDVDAAGQLLPPELSWQPELWRRLRDRIAGPTPGEQWRTALARVAEDPAAVDLPSRISVFGVTRLDPDLADLLAVLARHRDLHLWLPHPSPAQWAQVGAELRARPLPRGPRTADPTAALPGHPLLTYLGRDARELQVLLGSLASDAADQEVGGPPLLLPSTAAGTPILRLLQDDLAANRLRDPASRRLAEGDRSIAVHATYGPDRQVEVLREVLLGLLADDLTLEPRDIVVMCPDIERFAPLISAAFGLDTDEGRAEHPGHRLRVRLADRALRQVNPLLAVLDRVLELAESRLTASAVLDLVATPPVARRFGFGEEDLDRLATLVEQSGVRWGLDAEHRRPYGLAAFGQNTWAAGLDRLLLGVAMDEEGEHFLGTTLPLDDVDSGDVDLLGRFAELLSRLAAFLDATRHRHARSQWHRLTRGLLAGLCLPGAGDSWQLGHAYAELARLGEETESGDDPPLGLAEVRAVLGDTFRGRASRANFRTGTLTVATLHPMRSVPHRVVCLLGMDDGTFPRKLRPVGDDILAHEEWLGDPDPRSEDRQLLLDALLAAEEHLVVLYSGCDPHTGTERPPAVPIGELLDTLDVTATAADGRPVREHLIHRHGLQPFDPSNFEPDVLAPGRFSFDAAALRGARAAERIRQPPAAPYAVGVLPPLAHADPLPLPELIGLLSHPAKALLRSRAHAVPRDDPDEPHDQLPADLDALERWAVGNRMLERRLQGASPDQLAAAEWRRGTLPPRRFGQDALAQILAVVEEVAEQARPYLGDDGVGDELGRSASDSVDVRLELEVGGRPRGLAGTLRPVHGSYLVRVGYGRVSAKGRLASWVSLLALTAARPGPSWQAVTVGRGGRSVLGPIEPEWAGRVLADLVELYDVGLRELLPFSPRTSAEYAAARAKNRSLDLYRRRLDTVWSQERDVVWERFLGAEPGLDRLLEQPSLTTEERGTLAEPTRFGTLARRVFHPLLHVEDLT